MTEKMFSFFSNVFEIMSYSHNFKMTFMFFIWRNIWNFMISYKLIKTIFFRNFTLWEFFEYISQYLNNMQRPNIGHNFNNMINIAQQKTYIWQKFDIIWLISAFSIDIFDLKMTNCDLYFIISKCWFVSVSYNIFSGMVLNYFGFNSSPSL